MSDSSGSDGPILAAKSFEEHLEFSIDRREQVAEELVAEFETEQLNGGNDDEDTRREFDGETVVPFGYQKGLGYETAFGNTEGCYDRFTDAIEDDATKYPIEGTRPLVSPPSAQSVATDGTDPWLGAMPPAPDHDSPVAFLEMLEAYLATHARETPFAEYGDGFADSLDDGWLADAFERDREAIADALPADTGSIDDWIEPPGEDLFRDAFPGCRVGPYASQHFFHDVRIGGQALDASVRPITEGPFGETFDAHEAIVRSSRPGAEPGHDDRRRVDRGDGEFVHTGHHLASHVRDDPAHQPYLIAALQLLDWEVPYADDVQYEDSDSILPYIDNGAVAILDLLGRVTRNALLSAWHQKWSVHRRLRPETYAGRVHVALDEGMADVFAPSAGADLPAFTEMDVPRGLSEGKGDGSTTLLPLAYPEGAPAHPAYPSGHSTIAGACATVLKTFFEDASYDELPNVEAKRSPDGERLVDVDDPGTLTVHGEVNKLASNVGMGRVFAGVHYRTDHVYGMALGEQVAVATLYDHFRSTGSDLSTDAEDLDAPLEFDPLVGGVVSEPVATPESFGELREGTRNAAGALPETQ